MASNKISVLIDVTVDKANKALTNFRKEVSSAEGAVGKFKAGASSASSSLKANIVPVAAAAGVALVGFATKAVAAASDLQESTNAVNKSFGAAAEGVLEVGENSAESFGLSKAAFNEAAVAFSAFASEIAGPGGDVAKVVEDLTTRAADFASVMNIDVAEASLVFRSGLSGETEPLKRFGINLSAAAVEAYALSTGLAASKDEMTEAIKVQARYGLLMAKTANTAGDFADTADGLANSTRIASARFTDFQAEVGEELIPVVQTALGVVLDLADAMETLGMKGQLAGEQIGDDSVWGELKENIEGVLNPVGNLGRLWNTVDETFSGASDSAEELTNSMSDAEINAGRLAHAADQATAAAEANEEQTEDNVDALNDLVDAQNEAREALDAQREAQLEAIDASLGYRNQTARTAEEIRKANEVLGDAESSADDAAQAYRDMEGAALDQAAAAVALADDQASANGETLSAREKTAIYKRELQSLRDYMTGDAAIAIQMHIDALNRIPRSINTVASFRSQATPGASSGNANSRVYGLHDGGIVKARPGGVPAVLAEAGEDEVVAPLSDLKNMGVGGSGPIYLTVNAGLGTDGRDVGRLIVEELQKYQRRNGPGSLP